MLVKDSNLKKRLLKRSNTTPKNLDEIFKNFSMKPLDTVIENPIVKRALCKRLANRELVIDATVFTFNKEGICEFRLRNRAGELEAFDLLIKRPGVTEIVEQPRVYADIPMELPLAAPEPSKYDIIDTYVSDESDDSDQKSSVIEIDMVGDDEVAPKKRKNKKSKFNVEEG